MSLAAPIGGLSLAEDYLAATLASSAAFRTMVGAGDSAAARQRIHFTAWPRATAGGCYTPEEIEQYLPSAMIFTGQASGYL
jgi:hypothetical protein